MMRNCAFAVHGKVRNPARFSRRTFQKELDELYLTGEALRRAAESFLFWEGRGVHRCANVAVLLLFQLALAYPARALALLPALLLTGLATSYLAIEVPHPIERKPRVSDFLLALVCGRYVEGIYACPDASSSRPKSEESMEAAKKDHLNIDIFSIFM